MLHLWWGDAVEAPEATWPEEAWLEVTRSIFRVCPAFFRVFSYYGSSTKTMAARSDRCHVTPSGFPCGAFLPEVTSPVVTEGHPKGVDGVCVCVIGSALGVFSRTSRPIFSMVIGTSHPRPMLSMATGTSPGYLPLSRHSNFIWYSVEILALWHVYINELLI